MAKKKMLFNFPPHLIDQPVTYRLVHDHGLVVNILRANIAPNEWGRLVVELNGPQGNLQGALDYLAELGVGVEPLAEEVRWLEDRCIHCTACIAPCPTHALNLDRAAMTVSFDRELCIACELCLNVCPYRAIEIMFG